jgi:hypothetical protein
MVGNLLIMNSKYNISKWYKPGNWRLPSWWTDSPYSRHGRLTYEEQVIFYNSNFCKKVLKHNGGIRQCPPVFIKPR